MQVEISPEKRVKIAERYEKQLDGMLKELEGWYPDKRLTSAQLKTEHGNFRDRLGSLASDMGYGSFCDLLRFEGFEIELDRKSALNPVENKIVISEAVDGIIERVSAKLDSYIEKIDGWYPDGNVSQLAKEHTKTKENLNVQALNLGFESWAELLEQLGYTFPQGRGPKRGRRAQDPEATISELMARYEGKEKPESLLQLKTDNPDMKGKIKTLGNQANDLFGHTLAVELTNRGLIAGKKGDFSDDEIREFLNNMVSKYADASPKPSSISELENDNPGSKEVIGAFRKRCSDLFGITPLKKLEALGIIEKAKGFAPDTSVDDVERAITELGGLVSNLADAEKLDSLPALEKAYPDYSEPLKAGRAMRLIDKAQLQKLGILAPAKALLRQEGIRRASAETLAEDYLSLGKAELIEPRDPDERLLPSNVAGIDIASRVELREINAIVKGEPAKALNVGDKLSVEVSQSLYEDGVVIGQGIDVVNIQTNPVHSLQHRLLRSDLVGNSESELSAYAGAEVISVSHGASLDAAQMRVRYLAALNRDTLAYMLRELGIVTEKDLHGSMEWRLRIATANGGVRLTANAPNPGEGAQTEKPEPDNLSDEEIEALLADVKSRYAHKVRPKSLKELSAENPDFERNVAPIKRYLKARGRGPLSKYLEEQGFISKFWREDSLPRPEDQVLEEFQSQCRMTAEELLEIVSDAELIEFDTSVAGNVCYGQPPYYEMLRVGDFLDAWVDKGTWVHMSFCGYDLGLVAWKERNEYCLADYIENARVCGVVNERVYARITGFAGGPIMPKAILHVFFAVDHANQVVKPVRKDPSEWGLAYDFGE